MRYARFLPFAAVVAVALVLSFPPPPKYPNHPIIRFPDSVSYLEWDQGRPPIPSLFYLLVGSGRTACLAQTLLSVVCWTALGWSALGVVGAALAAALAVSLPVALWNFTVLSEPIALSLGAALCASTLALGRCWTRPRFAVWAACVLSFTGVRVENFIVVPVFTTALLAWHRTHWRALMGAGAAAAVMFIIFGFVADMQGVNWQLRMTNVVLDRILPDPELAAYFHARGMPQEAALLPYQGRVMSYFDDDFRAQTPALQRWLDRDSRRVYMGWLATAAPHRMLLMQMDGIMERLTDRYYFGSLRLPASAYALIPAYDAMQLQFRHWCGLAIIPLLCVAVSRQLRFVDLFALAYLLAVYLLTFAAFHGDACEVERHLVLAAALYRMAPVVVLASVWERVLAFARRSPQPAPA